MDRPPPHHRVNDRPNGGSDHIVVGGAGVGDHRRMPPSRWSNDNPRGGGGDFSAGGGGGVRFHPYQKQEFGGNGRGGGFHGGPDGGGFGPMGGPKRGFPGRGGLSPDFAGGNKFIKLFVGSVPRTATEEDIRPLFEEHGNVIEVALIRDRTTGQQHGFCFVKYGTMEEAERAIAALHNKCTLPGALAPLQVRCSDGSRERQEDKLFVASLNRRATEQEITDIFSPYGQVEDVYMMRDESKQFRGCGFVRFTNRESASAAMNALHGTYVMKGCDQPLIVRFADPKRPRSELRNGPVFGGPGFGPRPEVAAINGSKFDESLGAHMPPNAWRPDNQQLNRAPQAPQASSGMSGDAGGMAGGHQMNFPTPSLQQGFNPSMPQFNPQMNNQHLQQMQKQPMASQNFPPFQQHLNQQVPSSHSEVHSVQAPMQQQGQIQHPQMANTPSHQSQSAAQQNHIGLPNANQQMMQRPMQQMPSQAPQVLLQQQSQNLQTSFQSSQAAIFQLQQQLHLMQQSGSNQQHIPQNTKQQQTPWNGPQPTNIPASTPAVPTTSMPMNTTSAAPLTCNWTEHTSPQGIKYYYNSVTQESKWDKPEEYLLFEQQQQQHKLAVQPNQQIPQSQILPNQQIPQTQILPNQQLPQTQMLPNQQLPQAQMLPNQQLPQAQLLPNQQLPQQTQLLPNQQLPQTQMLSNQQMPQTQVQPNQQTPQQQLQSQMQLRQQAQMQLYQTPLQYQSTGMPGQQNLQNYNYNQLQNSNPITDASRGQQALQDMWQNKPTGS